MTKGNGGSRKKTVFSKANKLFRDGKLEAAEKQYYRALWVSKSDAVSDFILFNLSILYKRQEKSCESSALENLLRIKNNKKELVSLKHELINKFRLDKEKLIINANLKNENNSFKALNDDPSFLLSLENPVLRGFQLVGLKLKLLSERKNYTTRLYLDYGDGFNENDTVNIFGKSEEQVSRVIFLKAPVKSVRIDPIDHKDEFVLDSFSFGEIDHQFAKDTMMVGLLDNEKVPNLGDNSQNANEKLYTDYDAHLEPKANKVSYKDWIKQVELPSLPSKKQVQRDIQQWQHKPLFSIVMPTYNTDEQYLRECIESVLNQSYPYIEFCIADDNSPKPHVVKVIDEYAKADSRVKVVKRVENGHISRATNSAIEVATGDYIVLLDHDDMLAKHALYFMAEAINHHPDAKILYSDEDKIDQEGNRSSPHFKCDWNPDLFFSQNYVSHLGVYKTEIIKKIGGFRTGVEGSQDQDLLLRCLSHVKDNEIHHIPRILYHWRMLEGSTALASGEKSYTTEAGIKALQDYFTDNGPSGVKVEAGLVPNTYKVNWPLPDKAPKVSLLIPTRDRKAITEVAVRSILEKTTYPNYEIVILDNGSVEPETLSFFRQIQEEDERVSVLRYDHPFNYSAINNFGVKQTSGELVGLINNDIEVINPEWLTEMVSHAIRPDIGCVGAKLYYSNGQIQHGGVILGIGGVAGHSHKYFDTSASGYFSRLKLTQNLSAVTAAVLIVRRNTYLKVGGLNEKDLKVAFNDVDFCLKVRQAGYRNLWTPYAELYHHESISRGHEDTKEKKDRFKTEVNYMVTIWGGILTQDPFYNPHLTTEKEDFSIGI
ncbi:glycosyltransferase family 2 protein [Idiomarina aquatica]|uniref:Glycosyltransferase family 2 protein n=1 Tax=Idiomarina aquatica TaxID=1327752 RepID=A0AA94EIH3_9GAMM|nr:glycosyltransferase family 2 protein [Idiomarina aquatica]RUO45764.1 glycosyltransferase family 2 protein [Idiomarina aquatica]